MPKPSRRPARSRWSSRRYPSLWRPQITGQVDIPTIGIGASAVCDGQILVLDDMLGLTGRVPKFVKTYGQLAADVRTAVSTYATEVRARQFPGPDHVYSLKAE